MQSHQIVAGRQHHAAPKAHSQGHKPESDRNDGLAAINFLADRNHFIAYAMKRDTPVPKTAIVKKGAALNHVGFVYPLWVRASQGERSFFCHNELEKKFAIHVLHGQSYQLQESLVGYCIYRVAYAGSSAKVFKVFDKGAEEILPCTCEHVLALGVTRRISDSIRAQGVDNVCFNVAMWQETAYVTGLSTPTK